MNLNNDKSVSVMFCSMVSMKLVNRIGKILKVAICSVEIWSSDRRRDVTWRDGGWTLVQFSQSRPARTIQSRRRRRRPDRTILWTKNNELWPTTTALTMWTVWGGKWRIWTTMLEKERQNGSVHFVHWKREKERDNCRRRTVWPDAELKKLPK